MAAVAAARPAAGGGSYGFSRDAGDYRVHGPAELARVLQLALDAGCPGLTQRDVQQMLANVEAGKRDPKHYIDMYTARLAKIGVDASGAAPRPDAPAALGGGVAGALAGRAQLAQEKVGDDRFMGMATAGIDDDLEAAYRAASGRPARPPSAGRSREPEPEPEPGTPRAESPEPDEFDERADTVSTMSMGSGVAVPVGPGYGADDHPTLRLRRPGSASSSLDPLDRTRPRSGRPRSGRPRSGRVGRPRSGHRTRRSQLSKSAELSAFAADEGAPSRITVHEEMKMDSPRDGNSEGLGQGNPMMGALRGGSRSADFHKSMSHHDLNQLLHSFGVSVTKSQVQQIVSRSYRLSKREWEETRFSPPRERQPSPTERDFVKSVLKDRKHGDHSGATWSRVTSTAAAKHSDAFSALSEESSMAEDYTMEKPPMNITVEAGYRKLSQAETSSAKNPALSARPGSAASRSSKAPQAIVRPGGRARHDARQRGARKGTLPAHEWTVLVTEAGGADLQPYLESVVFRLSGKLWDQPFVVCEEPPYELTLGAMNTPLRMVSAPVSVELRLKAGGGFTVPIKLSTAPTATTADRSGWNVLSGQSVRKLSFDVVSAPKLRQEKEERELARQLAETERRQREWAEWKETEAAVRAGEASLREEHAKTQEEVSKMRGALDEQQERAAATRIQSVYRGRSSRRGPTQPAALRRHWTHWEMQDTPEASAFLMLSHALAHRRQLFGKDAVDVRRGFELQDPGDAGAVAEEAFAAVLKKLELGLTDAELEQVMAVVLRNDDGLLDYKEFCTQLSGPEKQQAHTEEDDALALIARQADAWLGRLDSDGFGALEAEWAAEGALRRDLRTVVPPSDQAAIAAAVSSAVLALLGKENEQFAAGGPVYALLDHVKSLDGWKVGIPRFLRQMQMLRDEIEAGRLDATNVQRAQGFLEICIDTEGALIKTVADAKEDSEVLVAKLCRSVLYTVAYANLVAETWEAKQQEAAVRHIQARQRGNATRKEMRANPYAPKVLIGVSDRCRYRVWLTRVNPDAQPRASSPSAEDDAGTMTMTVTCPEGIQKSRVLIVRTPGATHLREAEEEIEIIVPEDVQAREVFHVRLRPIEDRDSPVMMEAPEPEQKSPAPKAEPVDYQAMREQSKQSEDDALWDKSQDDAFATGWALGDAQDADAAAATATARPEPQRARPQSAGRSRPQSAGRARPQSAGRAKKEVLKEPVTESAAPDSAFELGWALADQQDAEHGRDALVQIDPNAQHDDELQDAAHSAFRSAVAREEANATREEAASVEREETEAAELADERLLRQLAMEEEQAAVAAREAEEARVRRAKEEERKRQIEEEKEAARAQAVQEAEAKAAEEAARLAAEEEAAKQAQAEAERVAELARIEAERARVQEEEAEAKAAVAEAEAELHAAEEEVTPARAEMVNRAERMTGKDIDGDGDIGLTDKDQHIATAQDHLAEAETKAAALAEEEAELEAVVHELEPVPEPEKVLEPEPEPEPVAEELLEEEAAVEAEADADAAAAAGDDATRAKDALGTEFICVLRSIIRTGCELDSPQVKPGGFLQVGEHIFAEESVSTAEGVERIRTDRGWVSRSTKSGRAILMNKEEFFASADADGDGVVSKDEFAIWHLATLGTAAGVEEFNIFFAADTDGNGSISQEEFEAAKPLFLDPALRAKAAVENWVGTFTGAADVALAATRWKRKGAKRSA